MFARGCRAFGFDRNPTDERSLIDVPDKAPRTVGIGRGIAVVGGDGVAMGEPI